MNLAHNIHIESVPLMFLYFRNDLIGRPSAKVHGRTEQAGSPGSKLFLTRVYEWSRFLGIATRV
jgi:hypothetical protein